MKPCELIALAAGLALTLGLLPRHAQEECREMGGENAAEGGMEQIPPLRPLCCGQDMAHSNDDLCHVAAFCLACNDKQNAFLTVSWSGNSDFAGCFGIVLSDYPAYLSFMRSGATD